jgi:hypothetical protein
MRILITADAELPVPPQLYGGNERVISFIVEEFRRRGHVVGLVAPRDSVVETDFFGLGPASPAPARAIPSAMLSLSSTASPFYSGSSTSVPDLRFLMPYGREPSGRTDPYLDRFTAGGSASLRAVNNLLGKAVTVTVTIRHGFKTSSIPADLISFRKFPRTRSWCS